MLSGGSEFDLRVIFDIEYDHCLKLFYNVLLDWIIKTNTDDIIMMEYLGDELAMSKVSDGFSKQSHVHLKVAIGVVQAVFPSWRFDKIRIPVTFFHSKDFMH